MNMKLYIQIIALSCIFFILRPVPTALRPVDVTQPPEPLQLEIIGKDSNNEMNG